MNQSTIKITRTAMFLALAFVFQLFGRLVSLGDYNTFIVGSMVNACLIISTLTVGLWSGVAIAVLTPLTALFTVHSAVSAFLLPFAPFVALGNLTLVLSIYMFRNKNKVVGLVTGAIVKFGVLIGSVNLCLYVIGGAFNMKQPIAQKLATFMFSWPQLVTAILGGIISFAVIRAINKSFRLAQAA